MNGFKYIRTKILNNTMQELANILGVSKQTVYLWESGMKNIPSKRLQQLFDICGIPENYFFILAVSETDKQEIKKYYFNKEQKGCVVMKQIKDFIMENSVGEGYLSDWYISSVDDAEPPVWTDAHIAEVYNDFYLIPREVVEKLI